MNATRAHLSTWTLLTVAAVVWSQPSLAATGPGCVISGTGVVKPFAPNPATGGVPNYCQQCDPGLSVTGWSNTTGSAHASTAGLTCEPSEVCCTGACTSACYINSQCFVANTIDSTDPNVCKSCQPGVSTSSWSPLALGTSCTGCGGGTCTCQNGNCVSSCISLTCTNGLNFGSTYQNPTTHAYCSSTPLTCQILNTCTSNVTISSVTSSNPSVFVIASYSPSTPSFISYGSGGANNPDSFTVTFEPTTGGTQTSTISVNTSLQATPYTVSATGTAVGGTAQNTDTFVVATTQTLVDMLFSVDTDDCSESWWAGVASTLIPSMFAKATSANINFNLAMMNTYLDVTNGARGDQGNIEPCSTCANTTNPYDGTTTKVFNASNGNAQHELIGLIGGQPYCGYYCSGGGCENGCGPGAGCWVQDQSNYPGNYADEDMFDSQAAALQPSKLTGSNSGLIRTGTPGNPSYLGLMTLEDDNEDNHGWAYEANVAAYFNFFVGVKGAASLVTYSYASSSATDEAWGSPSIGGGNNSCAPYTCPAWTGSGIGCFTNGSNTAPSNDCAGPPFVNAMAARSGGVITDMTQSTWVQQVVNIWATITAKGQTNFSLTELPGTGLTVTVNGTAEAGNGTGCPATGAQLWCYNTSTNAINFVTAQTPGVTVAATYTATCP